MTGIVVVSHSNGAAEGIREIAREMAGEDVAIETAGGGENGELGTAVPKIIDAIETATDDQGVVVLVDLGSSVVNAKTALSMVDSEGVIADAPVLEGTLNAAMEATSNSHTISSVCSAAESSREVLKLS